MKALALVIALAAGLGSIAVGLIWVLWAYLFLDGDLHQGHDLAHHFALLFLLGIVLPSIARVALGGVRH